MMGKLKGDQRFPFIMEVKEAEEYLNKALLANPNSFQTIHNLANISVYRKQYKEAIEQYKKGLMVHEKYAISLYSLAITYKFMGEYSLSLETYLLCLKYHKDHAFSLHGLANLLIDLVYLQIKLI
jgi:tetratricopeptide (TPR) repeat protein